MESEEVKKYFEELKDIRRYLHSHPEVSGKEKNTSEFVLQTVSSFKPDQIVRGIGGNGLGFLFEPLHPSSSVVKTILVRSELDALPLHETNTHLPYCSPIDGVAHLCGHDGHMSIVIGVAKIVSVNRHKLKNYRVVIMFQPAEETGAGAAWMLDDEKFYQLPQPDHVIALHNLPGFPLKSIVVRRGPFSCASVGIGIKLIGKTTHAAYPENGVNPASAVCSILGKLNTLRVENSFSLVTIIYVRLGEIAFGTAAGDAEVMATLRAETAEGMKYLKQEAERIADESVRAVPGLSHTVSYYDDFPATENDPKMCDIVEQAANELNYEVVDMKTARRWSEDFGHFTGKFGGVMFGLGSGESCPQLHNPDYDFREDLIEIGANVFWKSILILDDE